MVTATRVFCSALLFLSTSSAFSAQDTKYFRGMCDASAAVQVDQNNFAVANDEDNILRIYNKETSGFPTMTFDLNEFLGTSKESDLEGAARVDDIIYWITSHGRNKSGKLKEERYQFFATKIVNSKTETYLQPMMRSTTDLIEHLLASPELSQLPLEEATRLDLEKAPNLAPKIEGLNIESLSASEDGSLLIGLRNPLVDGLAILIPLFNPLDFLSGERPQFGAPHFLDLNGQGIRDMIPKDEGFLLIAGNIGSARGASNLYFWDGENSLEALRSLPGEPEALVQFPGDERLFVLSDDGSKIINGEECKDLEPSEQGFEAFYVL